MPNPCEADDQAVENLLAYIRIRTVTTDTDYAQAVKFLECLARSLELDFSVVKVLPNRPVVIMKWPGTVSCSQSIVLNSHMDVVPADECKWEVPPFKGVLDACGRIQGRGSVDMKLQGIQYIEAIRRLKTEGETLKRTVVVLFMPDSESGSQEGMKLFVETPEFKCLNAGCWIDKSARHQCNKAYLLFPAQKHRCEVNFVLTGTPGPPWVNLDDTASAKLAKLLGVISDFRCQQSKTQDPSDPDGVLLITVNITNIKSVADFAMIPHKFVVTVDTRLPPGTCPDEWKSTLKAWCCEIGDGCCMEERICEFLDIATPVDNRFCVAIKETVNEMGFECTTVLNPGTSDARFARHAGIPSFGFSCLNGVTTPIHAQEEFIEKEKFVKGIEVYYNILKKIGNMPC